MKNFFFSESFHSIQMNQMGYVIQNQRFFLLLQFIWLFYSSRIFLTEDFFQNGINEFFLFLSSEVFAFSSVAFEK